MLWEAIYTLCLASFLYVAVKYIISLTQLKKYPPGPIPLPLVGNLHLLGAKPYESFKKLARTYGDVMSFSFGSQRIIVINGIHSGMILNFQQAILKESFYASNYLLDSKWSRTRKCAMCFNKSKEDES